MKVKITSQFYLDQAGELKKSYIVLIDNKRKYIFYSKEEVDFFLEAIGYE